ncbi:MAG: matrixin family metalloprotease [Nanoarchaeota archaeon]|nr:matrixin family metalloprotease [Nanoarchaeota archaeon]
MKRLVLVFLALVFSALLISAVRPDLTGTNANVVPSRGHARVTIPANAVEVAPGVFSLGSAVVNGRNVEGYALVHYKNGLSAKSGNVIYTSPCYAFLSNGAKWKTIEPWIVNPANIRGLDSNFVFSNLDIDILKWETSAGKNILGSGSITSDILSADTSSPDNKNEVYFAEIANPGVIAMTVIWGRFSGPVSQRVLVEWDQVYDDVDFDWSASGEAGKMDFENIATHELGHSVGMNDLYTTACSAQTMYGYASLGETKKRTLEAGDRTGVKKLYA